MNKSMTLYEISAELAPLETLLEESGGDVTGQEILVDRVTALLDRASRKIDAFGMYFRSMEATAKAIREEEIRLMQRRVTLENNMKRLRDAAKLSLETRGIGKMTGDIFTISVQRNGGQAPVEVLAPEDRIPAKFIRLRREVDIDSIRDGLLAEDPEAAAVARLGQIGTHVRIR